jgi:succinyl-CoA synthetase alpha subunit
MAILIDESNRVIVQGITGQEGQRFTERMMDLGTNIVGGVTPGKGGEWFLGKPVFDSVQNAVNATDADTSVVFVPAAHATDAIYEAIDGGIRLIVCVTSGVPVLDAVRVREYIRFTTSGLIGPNSPGILVPGVTSLGIIPGFIATPGEVGVVSRSTTLAFAVTHALTQQNIGQSTIVSIGADPILGTRMQRILRLFEEDPYTRYVVLLGEIGGYEENDAAAYIHQMTKPVIAHIAGRAAPPNTLMGSRGTIVDEAGTDAQTKIDLLTQAGARVVTNHEHIMPLIRDLYA